MQGNGFYKDIETIKTDVREIKDDLSHSIDGLTVAVKELTSKFDNWIHVAENQIPIKAVMAMFVILVLALAGVEGIDWLFKSYLKMP